MESIINPNYRPQASDTSIEADIYLFNRLRQLSFKQRLEIFAAHDRGVKKLSLVGVKMRNREAPIETIRLHFARAVLGDKFPEGFQPQGTDEKMWIQDSIALAGELHQILESVNILYYVSKGVASSIHGEARSTRDLDLVISLEVERIDIIVQTLETAGFYCPALSVEGVSPFWVASREDMVLQKLMWGRGSQSEKQWRDVLGIIKLQAENLDYAYLVEWAESLDLVDALTEALAEAGV